MSESIASLLRRAAALTRDGRGVYACLLTRARGSTPQSAGALMLIDDAATIHGTIGGGCVEAEVRRRAHDLLAQGRTGLLDFKLDHDYGWDDGLICGGSIEVAVAPFPELAVTEAACEAIEARQPIAVPFIVDTEEGPARYVLALPPRDRLYIAGVGHIGQALARQAIRLEYDVTIFDDRADLLDRYLPDEATGVGGDIATALRDAAIDDATDCVIVTRGHRHDEQALHAVVDRGARYVGMIGSRRKVKLIFDDLRELGVREESLAAVHAPIGLSIGAILVEEIALSIAAQLVEVRRRVTSSPVLGPEPVATTT